MNEMNNDVSVETYIKKQESLLLEQIRRYLQAETKVALLETALQDMYKNNEELSSQITVLNTTVEQSINGLQSTTADRDHYMSKADEVPILIGELNQSKNTIALLKEEIKELNEALEVSTKAYSTLKENYNKTVEALNTVDPKLSKPTQTRVKQNKKSKNSDAEWVDGKHEIST